MKNLLLIDCYDSFTDILAQTIENSGLCNVEICPYDAISPKHFLFYDGFVLSPGPGLPYEYSQIFLALQRLKHKPVLGICMGHQIIGLASGARLRHLGNVVHGQMTNLQFPVEDTIFSGIKHNEAVGLYHSWVLDKLPSQLLPIALSSDAKIMAIRHKVYPWIGLQFHPESYMTSGGKTIINNWLKNF
ncbi:MAG: gamma-glutamyl-gamma-aminobutyrate hydrolase family protein [Bacteroidota bacterium]|nr:gamma-glutamyl-gamma-aminobutyrate hydrolase family protein [Bacteroidota bacterium]